MVREKIVTDNPAVAVPAVAVNPNPEILTPQDVATGDGMIFPKNVSSIFCRVLRIFPVFQNLVISRNVNEIAHTRSYAYPYQA